MYEETKQTNLGKCRSLLYKRCDKIRFRRKNRLPQTILGQKSPHSHKNTLKINNFVPESGECFADEKVPNANT